MATGLAVWKALPARAAQAKLSTPCMEKLGWQLSVQLYTYRRYPLFEALDKVADLGIRHIEPLTALKVDAKRPALLANERMMAQETAPRTRRPLREFVLSAWDIPAPLGRSSELTQEIEATRYSGA